MSSEGIDKEYLELIVKNLLSGMDIVRVPSEYIQYIFEPLAEEKEKAIKQGRVDTVKRIQGIVKQINTIQKPPEKSKTNEKPKKQKNAKLKDISANKTEPDDLIRQHIKKITNNESIEVDDPAVVQNVIAILKSDKEEAIHEGDYHQAQTIHNLIKQLRSRGLTSMLDNYKTEQFYAMQSQLADLEDDLQKTINYWKEQEAMVDDAFLDEEDEMAEVHSQQLEDFRNTWPSELPPCYRKVSPKVLHIREQEKHLVVSNRFDEAIEYKRMADKLEMDEIEQQRINFNAEFLRSLKHIKSAQKKEMDYVKERHRSKIQEIKTSAKKEIENKKRTINLLKQKMDPTLSAFLISKKRAQSMQIKKKTKVDTIACRESRIAASKIAYRAPWKY